MLILAIDVGKAKSLACWYQTDDATHEFRTVPTRPGEAARRDDVLLPGFTEASRPAPSAASELE